MPFIVALHEAEIREHVSRSLEDLERRMREHDAEFGARGPCTTNCRFCQLWAVSYASLRRMLDFLQVEIPRR